MVDDAFIVVLAGTHTRSVIPPGTLLTPAEVYNVFRNTEGKDSPFYFFDAISLPSEEAVEILHRQYGGVDYSHSVSRSRDSLIRVSHNARLNKLFRKCKSNPVQALNRLGSSVGDAGSNILKMLLDGSYNEILEKYHNLKILKDL